jgi:hypothetical protein
MVDSARMTRIQQLVVGATPRWLINIASRAKADVRNRLAARQYGPLVTELIPGAVGHELLVATDDAMVMRVALADGSATILKIATSEIASEQIATESAALEEIAQHAILGGWRDLVSVVDQRGTFDGGTWFTQSLLPGVSSAGATLQSELLVTKVVEALKPLHAATSVSQMVDDALLDDLVTRPLDSINQWRPVLSEQLSRINDEFRDRLATLELTLARQHGDFAPANVLWDPALGAVSGIVDWKLAPKPLPPELDYVHYALSLQMLRRRSEYGSTVVSLLGEGESAARAAPIRSASNLGPNRLDVRTVVTLAWLQHISFGLEKGQGLRTNPIWLGNNIDAVVRALQPM